MLVQAVKLKRCQGTERWIAEPHDRVRRLGEPTHQRGPTHQRRRRGFTLLESLVAVTLLGTVVLAVTMAISASQQVAFEGRKRMLAAIAAGDLMSELITLDYAQLELRDGTVQPIGALQTLDGTLYPDTFWALGRTVSVTQTTRKDVGMGVEVRGLLVVVTAIDENHDLAVLETFVPEPTS